jgi:hypothetical protein
MRKRESPKAVMHHAPESTTFSTSYDRHVEELDVLAVATGEEEDLDTQISSAALFRVKKSMVDRDAFLLDFVYRDTEVQQLLQSSTTTIDQETN